MKKYFGILVSHTHWDRAWYWPFQFLRARLIETIDQIIDVLEKDDNFKCFVLDGQTIIIEDYLEVKPENKEKIKKLVRNGKLIIGPWYVLMDEFLESPEAMIRNLMLGRKIADEFGQLMNEGYIPDSFGHIASLPKILSGFGIRSVIFTRGMGKEYEKLGNEFWWEANDGSKILAIYQRNGYWNCSCLGFEYEWGDYRFDQPDFNLALEKVKKEFNSLKKGAKTKYILLNNGTDHAPIQPQIPRIIKFLNQNLTDFEVTQGSFSDFVNSILKSNPKLETFRGELNKNYHHLIVQSVYSTRIYLKHQNFICQNLLEKYAEPLSAFLFTQTGEDYSPLIWTAWKTLLKNHPHDDICGCGIDEIHMDMEDRFRQVKQLAQFIIEEMACKISSMINAEEGAGMIFVYNPLNFERKELIKAQVFIDDENLIDGFILKDDAGNEIYFNFSSKGKEFKMGILKGGFKNVFEIEFLSVLPPTGYKIFQLVPAKNKDRKHRSSKLKTNGRKIENEFFIVTVNDDGTLKIKDKRNGITYNALNLFEDDEDAGDEYTYSRSEKSQKITSTNFKPKISLVEDTPFKATIMIEYDLKLPKSLDSDFKSRSSEKTICNLKTFITLYDGTERIDIRTEFENNARDHRLRVLFPTGIKSKTHFADGHFEILERLNPYLDTEELNKNEKPYTTRHQNTFVCLHNGKNGLMIANRGLPEYEILESTKGDIIALTLLRSVGHLSRKSLHRNQQAGPQIQTPDAQCLGKHIFEYSIIPIAGDFFKSNAYLKAFSFAYPPLSVFKTESYPYKKTLPPVLSLIETDSKSMILSSIKIAEDKEGIVVRFYNVRDATEKFKLKTYRSFKIYKADLKEDKIKEIKSNGAKASLTARKGEVLTLYFAI
ncbi:MAG: glycosyl hydrolase-related protein [Candidatus Kryptonium sp.]|nr:glycosyl hydrolase-related protein [Candidatus Kryptonium sp.]